MYVIPKYQAKTTLLLAQISEEASENIVAQSDVADFSMTSTLLKPYISIIESKKVLNKVISNLGLKMSEDTLRSMLTVTEENTAMLGVSVSSESPDLAERITNEIAEVFVEESEEIFNITNVNIIDRAERPTGPYNVNHPKDIVIFTLLGVFVSCGLIFLIYILDTTIKEEEDIETEIGLPVLGVIPIYERKLEKKLNESKEQAKKDKQSEIIILDNTKSPVAEAFRSLRTNVTFAQNTKTILVTSSRMSEGKSYISANLAATIAKADKKVIIVDADMRKGRQNRIFGVDNKKGLSNYLANCEETRVDISKIASYIKVTKVPNLHLITSGSRPSNPAELLSPSKIKGLISVLSEIYDIIIIDGTPSSIIADSLVIARYVDYTILVTAHKSTKVEDVKKLTKSFEQVGVKLNGAVLNKYPLTKEGYTSSYYYSDSKDGKLENKVENTEIRTVENFLSDANININSFRYIDEKEEFTNDKAIPAVSSIKMSIKDINTSKNNNYSSLSDAQIGFKIEKIDAELSTIKNMLMQLAVNSNQVTTKDVELIRLDINNLKDAVEENRENDDIRKLKEEINDIKDFTEVLVNSQKDNNEKIKRFIENYYRQRDGFTKKTSRSSRSSSKKTM